MVSRQAWPTSASGERASMGPQLASHQTLETLASCLLPLLSRPDTGLPAPSPAPPGTQVHLVCMPACPSASAQRGREGNSWLSSD